MQGQVPEPPVQLHEGLKAFQNERLRYLRVCQKVDHKGAMQRRALVGTDMAMFLCDLQGKGAVRRFLPYDKIIEVKGSLDHKQVPQLFFRLRQPEHDVLLKFPPDPLNLSPSTPEELEAAVNKLKTQTRHQFSDDLDFNRQDDYSSVASLKKSPHFVKPKAMLTQLKERSSRRGSAQPQPPPSPPPPPPQQQQQQLQPTPDAPSPSVSPPPEGRPEQQPLLDSLPPPPPEDYAGPPASPPADVPAPAQNRTDREDESMRRIRALEEQLRVRQKQDEADFMGGLSSCYKSPDRLEPSADDSVGPKSLPELPSPRRRTLSGLASPRQPSFADASLAVGSRSFWTSPYNKTGAVPPSPPAVHAVAHYPHPPPASFFHPAASSHEGAGDTYSPQASHSFRSMPHPPYLPCPEDEDDYWLRFVQRWEAQGVHTHENL